MGRSLLRAIKQMMPFQRSRKRWTSLLISNLGNIAKSQCEDLMVKYPTILGLIHKGA